MKNKNAKIAIICISIVLGIGLLLLGSIWAYTYFYTGKIYQGIESAGIKLGSKTPEEAKILLDKKVEEFKNNYVLIYEGKEWKPIKENLDIKFDTDRTVVEAFGVGRDEGFIKNIKDQVETLVFGKEIKIYYTLNNNEFAGYLSELAEKVNKPPKNPELVTKEGYIDEARGEIGRELSTKQLEINIKNSLSTLDTTTSALPFREVNPPLTEDGIKDAKEKATRIASVPISFKVDGEVKYSADFKQVTYWLKYYTEKNTNRNIDSDLILKVDPDEGKIREYADFIASELDYAPKDRQILSGTGQVIEEGYSGRSVKKDGVVEQIKNKMLANEKEKVIDISFDTIPNQTVTLTATPGPTGEAKCITINLSQQKIYAYEGTKLVYSCLVSSGRAGYETPTGHFSIYGKDRYCRMRGADYDLPNVPYTMWFYADYSIHGTYWHNNFGNVMSHGCVNLSISDAGWFYDWAPVGTSVVVGY